MVRDPKTPSILAGIVTYHPDVAHLTTLVRALASEVRVIAIYANSPLDAEVADRLRSSGMPSEVRIIRPSDNRGLGTAYDRFAELALVEGDGYLFLLDQDSLAEPGLITRLAAAHAALRESGERPAVVGPLPVDTDGRAMRVDAGAGVATAPRRAGFVNSSGSLIDSAALRDVGSFRSDFFIDAIDIEWCHRASARGYSIWIAPEARMRHSLGRGRIPLPFGIVMTDQPPLRHYTYFRNQIAMLRLPHVPALYKARLLLMMPPRILIYLIHGRFASPTRAAIARGIADGIRGRLGPPARL